MNYLQHLEMTQGDNVTFSLVAKDTQQNVLDLTGATVKWRVGGALGQQYVIQKTGVLVDPVNGTFTVTLVPSDTTNLVTNYNLQNQWWNNTTPQEDFVHEGYAVLANGNVRTCVQGRLRIAPGILATGPLL